MINRTVTTFTKRGSNIIVGVKTNVGGEVAQHGRCISTSIKHTYHVASEEDFVITRDWWVNMIGERIDMRPERVKIRSRWNKMQDS